MLSKITIKNFKSIETLVLDLSYAEGSAPNRYKKSNILSFIEPTSKSKDRLVSIMNIYGANASGKSNIIHALFCFHKIFSEGMKTLPPMFKVNKLKNLGNNSSIKLEFFIKKKKYIYTLEYNQFSITKEQLLVENEELFSIKNSKGDFKGLEIENFDNNNIKKRFEVSCLSQLENKKIQINTFLSSIVLDLPSLNTKLNLVNKYLKEDVFIALNNDISAPFSIDQLARSNKESDIDKAFDRISEFIKRLDIDIERFKYERNKDVLSKYQINENEYQIPNIPPNKFISINKKDNLIRISEIKSFHKNTEGNEITFSFHEESVGTQLSFGLIGTILRTLDKGGIFVIDELDRSLHSLLLKSLIKIFKDKEYNKNGAQLISTLHNTDVLDDNIYKISEFAFINKNIKQGSFIKRLSDFEGIRNDMNFRDRYLDGLYSGIPYPYN